MWSLFLTLLLSLSYVVAPHQHLRGLAISPEVALSTIQGSWIQVYSNHYVQSTSEIGYDCVRVRVEQDFSMLENPNIIVAKTAFEHGNLLQPVFWSYSYALSFSDPSSSDFADNLLLSPLLHSSSVVVPLRLRQTTDNYVLWTGNDNKTMFVWARHSLEAEEDENVVDYLKKLQFNTSYKAPLSSFSSNCFTLP